jgi:predicted nucleic acid-binding protein
MSRVFVDTSAIYALLVASDTNHPRAAAVFENLRRENEVLVTTPYVLVEAYALLGRRIGMEAVRAVAEDLKPLLEVSWIAEDRHDRGVALWLEREDEGLSLVDAVSFVTMRDERIDQAFVFDRHFEDEGFSIRH